MCKVYSVNQMRSLNFLINSKYLKLWPVWCPFLSSQYIDWSLSFIQCHITLYSRGYFFLINTHGWRRSCVNEEKNNLWSQEYATSFPCEKSVQNLNWVTDWLLPCQVARCSQSGPLLYCQFPADMGVSNHQSVSIRKKYPLEPRVVSHRCSE